MNSDETSELLFGTGGVPLSAKSSSTEAGIERIAELGLGCMEVEFVWGVKMSPGGRTSGKEAGSAHCSRTLLYKPECR